jgi:transposase
MTQGTLIPNISEVALVCLRPKDGAIQMVLRACRSSSACPICGSISRRIHSRYLRKLGDLPWEKLTVLILLETRKFFCVEQSCRRTIFTERLPGTVARYARRTLRLSEALDWITLAVGGCAGARLARRLGLLVSGSTLLRQLRRQTRSVPRQAPRVLGIDDWAWRKGHRYGTILCDLEAGKVVDLLPDRESGTVATWLRRYPGTEIVSRDRASAYAEATRRAAPQAIQVADRWHLMRNLSEALRNALEPHRRIMAQAARASQSSKASAALDSHAVSATPSDISSIANKSRNRRLALYEQIRALMDSGVSQSDIARQIDISLRTVQRWIRIGVFPERSSRLFPNAVNEHAAYLDQRLLEGCRNVSQLWRELRQQGFRGQHSSVRSWLRQHRGSCMKNTGEVALRSTWRTSPQQTTWQILKETSSAQAYLDELYRCSPEVATLAHLGKEFFRIVRDQDLSAWSQWLDVASKTALRGFARRLIRDHDAIQAALTLPWSNGPVEGQVHRLKLIKRQMYGRASFDLLRLRVLHKA